MPDLTLAERHCMCLILWMELSVPLGGLYAMLEVYLAERSKHNLDTIKGYTHFLWICSGIIILLRLFLYFGLGFDNARMMELLSSHPEGLLISHLPFGYAVYIDPDQSGWFMNLLCKVNISVCKWIS